MEADTPALRDPRLQAIPHRVTRHGPVASLEEAAAARGVPESSIIKTMVVRLSEADYAFILVPGDRVIDWAKLRSTLGVNRLSLPDEATALEATGYARGTITPFGASRSWPVYADSRVAGAISIGGGAKGVAISVSADDAIEALGGVVADITKPSRPIDPSERDADRQR